MKVLATLATILGVAYATPNAQIHNLGHMGPLRSALQQHNVVHTSTDNVMPNMRMSTLYQVQTGPTQAQTDPNQYHLQDAFGNFEYAWKNQGSEKMEKGNDMSVRGRYAYIMSDGALRHVEYIADNSGFHVLQDNADNSRAQDRNKRSVEPDLFQTRMTSFMDSSSLRDDSMVNPNMYNMMGRDMSNNMMQRNRKNDMSSNHNMYGMAEMSSNRMGNAMMGRNMNENIMGRDMNENIMGRNMNENIMGNKMMNENLMGRNMYSNDCLMTNECSNMSSNMMNRNMMSQDMLSRNIMGQDISSNMMGRDMYTNIMGRDMSSNVMNRNMMAQDMSSNIMGREMSSNRMNTYSSDVNRLPLDQRNTMSQRMEIEQIPQSLASNQFF